MEKRDSWQPATKSGNRQEAAAASQAMESSLAKRRAQTLRKAEAGRLIVRLQRQIVHELRASGRDSKAAEALLMEFEQAQDIFERELAALS